jgi:hypothetical protein
MMKSTTTSGAARRAHRRGGMPRSSKDPYALTRDRAEALAAKIRAYWQGRGHQGVRIWIEPITESSKSEFAVRSDISVVERPMTTSSSEAPIA